MLKTPSSLTVSEHEIKTAERRLLANILSGPNPSSVIEAIDPGDFLTPGHSDLFAFIQGRHAAALPVDSQSILEALREADPRKIVDRVGGWEGLCEMTDGYSAALSGEALEAYTKTVKRGSLAFRQRRLLQELDGALRAGDFERAGEMNRRLQALFDQADSLGGKLGRSHDFRVESLAEIWKRHQATIAEECKKEGPLGLKFGISTLDLELEPGLRAGRFMLIGALTSQGKSVLGLQIALETAKMGLGVLFLTWEMLGEELSERAAADGAGVEAYKIQQRRLSEDEKIKLAFYFPPDKVRVVYASGLRAGRIFGKVKEARALFEAGGSRLALVVLDHLQLIHTGDRDRGESRALELQTVADTCKEIALTGAGGPPLAVLGLSQLNRATDKASPEMSNLKDSSGLEQAADIVILLGQKEGRHFAKIKKNRAGKAGEEIKLRLDPNRMRFD